MPAQISTLYDAGCEVSRCPLRVKSGHLRCGSDVRFTPESGHVRCTSACPLCANSGLMQRSKKNRYSITSSARPSNLGGTSMPSDLAVLELTAI